MQYCALCICYRTDFIQAHKCHVIDHFSFRKVSLLVRFRKVSLFVLQSITFCHTKYHIFTVAWSQTCSLFFLFFVRGSFAWDFSFCDFLPCGFRTEGSHIVSPAVLRMGDQGIYCNWFVSQSISFFSFSLISFRKVQQARLGIYRPPEEPGPTALYMVYMALVKSN